MLYLRLLRHRLLQTVRQSLFQGRVAVQAVKVLVGLYMASVAVLLGVLAGPIAEEMGMDVLTAVNGVLGPGLLGLTAARFFLEGTPTLAVRPYLSLPVPRRVLLRYFLVTAQTGAWNGGMALFLVSCWGIHGIGSLSAVGSGMFLAGGLALVAASRHASLLLHAFLGNRPAAAAGVLAAVVAGGAGAWGAGLSVVDGSRWLFGGLQSAAPLPVLFALGTYAALHAAHRTQLHRTLRLDASSTEATRSPTLALRWLEARGAVGQQLAVDLRFLLRTTQPRRNLLMILFMVPLMGVLFWGSAGNEALFQSDGSRLQLLMLGFFGTSWFPIQHGQLLFAWHGTQLDAWLARDVAPRTLLMSKVLLLQGHTAATLVALVPPAVLFWSPVVQYVFAVGLFSMGMAAPLMVGAALFNHTPQDPDATSFMDANFAGVRSMLVLAVLGTFAAPVFLLDASAVLLVFAGAGSLGLLALPLWLRALTALWHRRRHPMMEGFRKGP